jgi:hypothetical protein
MRDLTCTNGRAHDGSEEDVDADGSVGQAITVGSKFCYQDEVRTVVHPSIVGLRMRYLMFILN